MPVLILVVSFAIKHDCSKTQIVFRVVNEILHVRYVAVGYSHTIITQDNSVIIFRHVRKCLG